ncbi:MAG: HAMP domain-containing sensor histidine kinase [Pseudomonadota bacterium]
MFSSISARLLVVTVLVVMIVEIAIFVPSIANFRARFLEERLVRAEIAALTVMTAPGGLPPPETTQVLLESSSAEVIAVKRDGVRMLALVGDMPPIPAARFDLRDASAFDMVVDALKCLVMTKDGDVHHLTGRTQAGIYDTVEVTFRADELRSAMIDYGLRILQLSLIISAITAGAVFIVVRRFVVAPLFGVISAVERFHADPEDPTRVLKPSNSIGEMVAAERAIGAMQSEVLRALSERRRLAALGEAVAKINHDLRNMLAAGRLMTERLGRSEDPLVARVLPKLVTSIDRAVALCTRTLDFGKAEETRPEIGRVVVGALLEEVVEGLGLAAPQVASQPAQLATGSATGHPPATGQTTAGRGAAPAPNGPLPSTLPEEQVTGADRGGRNDATAGRVLAEGPVRVISEIGPEVEVAADPDQLYRIMANLLRNASEALRARAAPGTITVSARPLAPLAKRPADAAARAVAPGTDPEGAAWQLQVADTGPGLPAKALENLFRPFIGGARRGGTGLGLAIAAELTAMQGGRLSLVSTASTGTVFALVLPDADAARVPERAAVPSQSAHAGVK